VDGLQHSDGDIKHTKEIDITQTDTCLRKSGLCYVTAKTPQRGGKNNVTGKRADGKFPARKNCETADTSRMQTKNCTKVGDAIKKE